MSDHAKNEKDAAERDVARWVAAEKDPTLCAHCGKPRSAMEQHFSTGVQAMLVDRNPIDDLDPRWRESDVHAFQRCFGCLAESLLDRGYASYGPLPAHGTPKRYLVDRLATLAILMSTRTKSGRWL